MGKELKETFSYATERRIRDKAAGKAHKEGLTLSEKIDQFLRAYIKHTPVSKGVTIDLPADYVNFDKIGILREDGTIESLGSVVRKK